MKASPLRPPWLRRAVFAAVLGALVAVFWSAPVRVLNALVPEGGLQIERAIPYGKLPRRKLDVYRPANPPGRLLPVVVFFYGGAWQSGERADFLFVAEALVASGYVAVVPDYRVYPEVVFPAFVEDGAWALRWTLDRIRSYGGDPERVFVMGHSAGAQIAALLAFDPSYMASAGSERSRISGVVSLAGPMNFLPLTEEALFRVFPEATRERSQPIGFVGGGEPPVLLLHGLADTRVGLHNSRDLAARLAAVGSTVETRYYEDVDHIEIVAQLGAPLRWGKPVLADIARFIDRHASAVPAMR